MKQNVHPFVRHLEEVVQNYMQLIDKIIVISEDKITLEETGLVGTRKIYYEVT